MTTFTTEDREWAYWNTYECPKYNTQTEIKFFWPLTEQLSLGLDYTGCEKPKVYESSGYPLGNIEFHGLNIPTWTVATSFKTDTLTITSKNKPPLYRRVLYKLLGINWEQS